MRAVLLRHINHLAMIKAAFKIERCADATYSFRLVDAQQRALLSSDHHATQPACERTINHLKMIVGQQAGIHVLSTAQHNWMFVAMLNNSMLAHSALYSTLEACELDANRVRSLAPEAACLPCA